MAWYLGTLYQSTLSHWVGPLAYFSDMCRRGPTGASTRCRSTTGCVTARMLTWLGLAPLPRAWVRGLGGAQDCDALFYFLYAD